MPSTSPLTTMDPPERDVIEPEPTSAPDTEPDQRPRFAIGHLSIGAADVATLTDFYTRVGMRLVVDMGRATILELRGGTHLIVRTGDPGVASLDLIVDDIEETRDVLTAAGAEATTIVRGHPHDRFTATDPEGNTLFVNSNHAIGPV